MMFLYVDGYRGFSDTYVPIKDVNFLLGENSTGKTSLLSLMAIICGPRFWLGQEFTTDEIQLGTFKDIVSARSEDRRTFKVGFLESREDRNLAWLIIFGEEEGLPIARRFDFYREGMCASARLAGKKIRVKIKALDDEKRGEADLQKLFASWVKGEPKTGFKELKAGFPLGRRGWLLMFWNSVQLAGEEENSEKRAISEGLRLDFPGPFGNLAWLAPVRTKPRRTYDNLRIEFASEGEHTPYLMRRLLNEAGNAPSFRQYLSEFGRESDLFDSMSVANFGKERTSPFALNAVLNGKAINITNVGYGVSQSLPLIVELFARSRGSWFVIQQPEIHLHPRAQAAFGEKILNFAVKEDKRFLIETHSDYVVDRFRLGLRDCAEEKVTAQVLFFERTPKGNRLSPIQIETNGEYSSDQPRAFREFFIHEEMRLLGLQP